MGLSNNQVFTGVRKEFWIKGMLEIRTKIPAFIKFKPMFNLVNQLLDCRQDDDSLSHPLTIRNIGNIFPVHVN